METKTNLIQGVTDYRLLGRTGLRVSSLCLGTMTFGTEWGWGTEKAAARQIFHQYLESGGNFIDTADGYTNGKSEELLGEFIREANLRDRVVLATKFTFASAAGDPNGGGNGRKNIYRALEGSLRRLKTDYVDLYWMHAWDTLTPVEEVISTLTDLVREGKVRYIGLSDVPAWYASRAQTMAEWRGFEKVAALQLEYSLISRNLEREHAPMAQDLGIGICAWSPLAGGFLAGKYQREGKEVKGQGRIQAVKNSGNPIMENILADKNWAILDVLQSVANELGKKPAEVALNWVAGMPGVTSTIIGATKPDQLAMNLNSLEFEIPAALKSQLDSASHPAPTELDHFFSPALQTMMTGGTRIRKR